MLGFSKSCFRVVHVYVQRSLVKPQESVELVEQTCAEPGTIVRCIRQSRLNRDGSFLSNLQAKMGNNFKTSCPFLVKTGRAKEKKK